MILPTYNERENIPLVVARLEEALDGLAWEAIFVDDDSPDGTAEVIRGYALRDARIRLVHRIGRRGLASACIEGILATAAPCIAVMDADLQHDETMLPAMLRKLESERLDVVVGTRNAEGGSMGQFRRERVWLSRLGQRIGSGVCACRLSDPMSGFFLVDRRFLNEVVHTLQNDGFKILVDMLASSARPVRVGEVGYVFRTRCHGESKLDVRVGIEYFFLILNKRLGDVVPVQLAMYLLVGGIGLGTHLALLFALMRFAHFGFLHAQIAATFAAMSENFFLNNRITFRDRRFRGVRVLTGATRFMLACSFGAWANVLFARALLQSGLGWMLAGTAGIVLGSVWNLSVSSMFTWRRERRQSGMQERQPKSTLAPDFEALR